VLDILNRELAVIMRQAGTPTLADITSAHVLRFSPEAARRAPTPMDRVMQRGDWRLVS
jgi:hypothetical protein